MRVQKNKRPRQFELIYVHYWKSSIFIYYCCCGGVGVGCFAVDGRVGVFVDSSNGLQSVGIDFGDFHNGYFVVLGNVGVDICFCWFCLLY